MMLRIEIQADNSSIEMMKKDKGKKIGSTNSNKADISRF